MSKAVIGIIALAAVMVVLAILRPGGLTNGDAIFVGYVGGFVTAAWILPAIGRWLKKERDDT